LAPKGACHLRMKISGMIKLFPVKNYARLFAQKIDQISHSNGINYSLVKSNKQIWQM
jgi:hypothetical protein